MGDFVLCGEMVNDIEGWMPKRNEGSRPYGEIMSAQSRYFLTAGKTRTEQSSCM